MAPHRVDVAYALIEDSDTGRVLLVRNAATWSLPGGAREAGETLAQAAEREAQEETGLTVRALDVVSVSEMRGPDTHDVFVVFRADIVAGEVVPGRQADGIEDVQWVSPPRASELMPWYPGGVQALSRAGGAVYFESFANSVDEGSS